MPGENETSFATTIINSPPGTAFNIHSLLEDTALKTAYNPTISPETDSGAALTWIGNTPLRISIPKAQSFSETTQLTAITLTDDKSQSDIEGLLWNHLSNYITIIDNDRIETELAAAGHHLEDCIAYIATAQLKTKTTLDRIDGHLDTDTTPERFLITVEELSTPISQAHAAIQDSEDELLDLRTHLRNNDVKDSTYNNYINQRIHKFSELNQEFARLSNRPEKMTPKTYRAHLKELKTGLQQSLVHLNVLRTELTDFYLSATDNASVPVNGQSQP